MKWTLLIEAAFCFITLWVFVFQVVVPLLYHTPVFPLLRKAPREAERKYAEAVETRGVVETLRQADAILKSTKPAESVKPSKPSGPTRKRN